MRNWRASAAAAVDAGIRIVHTVRKINEIIDNIDNITMLGRLWGTYTHTHTWKRKTSFKSPLICHKPVISVVLPFNRIMKVTP